MIKVISIIGCIFVYIMWIWYELKHPMEDDTKMIKWLRSMEF